MYSTIFHIHSAMCMGHSLKDTIENLQLVPIIVTTGAGIPYSTIFHIHSAMCMGHSLKYTIENLQLVPIIVTTGAGIPWTLNKGQWKEYIHPKCKQAHVQVWKIVYCLDWKYL